MKAIGFGGLGFAGAMGVLLAACQPSGSPMSSTSPAAAVKGSHNAEIPAAALSEEDPDSNVKESSAVTSFRKYCYDTKSDSGKLANLIETDALTRADEVASGYSKSPQRGQRHIYALPSTGSENTSLNLVINDIGVCGVQVKGDGASGLEADVIESFSGFRVPAPQGPAVRAGVFIPYGSSISEQDVRRYGLINTMTSTAKGVAMVIYIPPAQAEEVLAKTRRQ